MRHVEQTSADEDDAELIGLCADLDDCERQYHAVYDNASYDESDDDLEAAAAAMLEPACALAERIRTSRVHSADGILAIARSVAVWNGDDASEFSPSEGGIVGALMTALMRESLLLSGLPVPANLARRR